jgi:glucosyl-3-phosphoglycerate synthase
MRADAAAWFEDRTSKAEDWTHDLLLDTKGHTTVSVVLPALNEEPTIGRIVHQINHVLGAAAPKHRRLVDELVVIDGGSADRTAAVAAAAGARVEFRADILPTLPSIPGKGDAMWRSLAVTSGDLVVFIDADLQSFTPSYITGLIGPLITNPEVALVKAVYERPLVEGSTVVSAGGGRVTELMARPLLNLLWPELAGIIQPLAGEYAARRELLEELPFPCGYGVEIGLLTDTLDRRGLAGLAQVDLGVRVHRHQDEVSLSRMAAEILRTAFERLERRGDLTRLDEFGTTLTQFARGADGFTAAVSTTMTTEHPPMNTVTEYLDRGRELATS